MSTKTITVTAHPNLAMMKYWGKADAERNLPATPSIGVSLAAFTTTTSISAESSATKSRDNNEPQGSIGTNSSGSLSWEVSIDGEAQSPERFSAFFLALERVHPDAAGHLVVSSSNSFPTAAGLASSASGFAALATAVDAVFDLQLDEAGRSALARSGSGSAARSVIGGFVSLPAGAECAHQLFPENHWPQLRCIIVEVNSGKKSVSSRKAMESSRTTSPYYEAWVKDAPVITEQAREAIAARDLDLLGLLIRSSYLRMFSTMFSAVPPVILWQAESLSVIQIIDELRHSGISCWETMDAGPQVKVFCLEADVPAICDALKNHNPAWPLTISGVGSGAALSCGGNT